MPRRPKSPCRHRGCGELLDKPGHCPAHATEAWTKRADAPKRGSGWKRQKARAQLFAEHPLCEECQRQGRVSLATERDHIVPLTEGGTDDRSNTQALCRDCHATKTQAEALRGRRKR